MKHFNSACAAPIAVAVLLASAVLVGCAQHDDSDPPGGRSGLIVYTDHLNGCQYLARPDYAGLGQPLTPRQGPDGKQVCNDQRERR